MKLILSTLNPSHVLITDYVEPGSYNPYNVRPWLIGNEYGALAMTFGGHAQEALDAACNAGLLAGLALDEERVAEIEAEDDGEGIMYLGNASQPHDSIHAWIKEVNLTDQQWLTIKAAYKKGKDTL